MHVVVLASRKGGSGKTTLAGHIAVEAERAGAGPVAVIDMDPQKSLAEWWEARQAAGPVLAELGRRSLPHALEVLNRNDTSLVVVDTPPAITTTIRDAIRVADLVIIPARPSPHDLRAVGATVECVEDLNKRLVFVLNGAHPLARITSEAVIALSQHGTVAPTVIHQRTVFSASMIDGRTACEVSGGAHSAAEITELWEYLDNRLNKRFLRTILPHRSRARGAEETAAE